MPYYQKDIVRLRINAREDVDPHPALILSCEDSITCENRRHYTGVMLTHMNAKNRFSFEITKDMIDGSWHESWSQARAHILVSFTDNDISPNNPYLGKMKKAFFKALLEHINARVFRVD